MYPQEVTLLEETFAYISAASATSPSKAPSSLSRAHIEAIISILERWPSSQRFPLIDLSRLVFAFCTKTPFDVQGGLKENFLDELFVAAEWGGSEDQTQRTSSPTGKVKETNTTLMLKALANAVGQDESGKAKKKAEQNLLRKAMEGIGSIAYGTLVKTQKVAYATVLFK